MVMFSAMLNNHDLKLIINVILVSCFLYNRVANCLLGRYGHVMLMCVMLLNVSHLVGQQGTVNKPYALNH